MSSGKKSVDVWVSPKELEPAAIVLDISHPTDQEIGASIQLTPTEARRLARKLNESADRVDSLNR